MNTLANRRLARKAVSAHVSCPVVIVPGDAAPRMRGESYYWTWGADPNGTRVWSNKGRSMHRVHYWPSSRRVVVGIGWLVSQQPDVPCDDRIDG